MRRWIKYNIVCSADKVTKLPQDSSLTKHADAIGYEEESDAYKNTNNFFKKYYYNYHFGRLLHYDKFLRKHIKKSDDILSVASGRSANELKLLEEGYNITCSELSEHSFYKKIKKLFPGYKFFTLDVLKRPADHKYDCLVSLSLIYLFDNDQLDQFFSNLSESCKTNGYLFLDSAGSHDNLLSYFIHDVLLKYEAFLVRFLRDLFQKEQYGLYIQDFGYRRGDIEIIEIAKKNNFKLIEQENFSFLVELQRSRILRNLIKISFLKSIFSAVGRYVPYIRMFLFKKMEG